MNYETKWERTKGQGSSNWMVDGGNFFHRACTGTPNGRWEPGRCQAIMASEGAIVR